MKVSYNNPHPSFWYGYVFNSQKWFYYQKYVNQINFNDLLFQVFVIIHLILNPSLKILKTLKTLKILTYVFDWLYFILCLTFFSSVDPPLLSGQFFDTASSTIAEILSIGPSANMLAVGDFGVHRKNWLAFSGGTDTTGELCYNFSISNGLRSLNFQMWSLTVIYYYFLFCSVFFCYEIFQKCLIFQRLFSKLNAPFHRTAFNYSRTIWVFVIIQ